MLTIDLSLGGGIKLLERALVAPVRSFNKKMQEVLNSILQVAVAADVKTVAVAEKPKLRIAKTTLPDQCLDFNSTFQHIRYELDMLYQQQNPLFTNTILPTEKKESVAAKQGKNSAAVKESIGSPLAAKNRLSQASEKAIAHQALHVAKTTLPDERLDFNQTFLHIRYGLDGFYGKQHLN